MAQPLVFTTATGTHCFSWDLTADRAELTNLARREPVWSGSLLPLFWLNDQGSLRAVKARARSEGSQLGPASGSIALDLGPFGVGQLEFTATANALKIARLEINRHTPGSAEIHSLYFGCDVLTPAQRQAAPSLERPFWPNWRAEGFAVASAKTNPMQSFFRSWDFGHTDLALGSFGPAMGTPYSAAFPRPTYAACAGGRNGWLCFGAGTVPNAALTFQVRARSAAIEWRYREDLWEAPPDPRRMWTDPLWLTWADSAWHAYRDYFRLFPPTSPKPASHQKTFWGTWGDFRVNEFELRSSIDRAVDQMEADLICIDDPWEAAKGSCRPHPGRLPSFSDDIAYAHARTLGVGIWMPMVWLEDFAAEGLTTDDLLLSRDGLPVRSNWAVDPHEAGQAFYCLDPSTPRTQRFLRERTQRVVREYRPTLLKIDFGYGVPGPDACAPRDPSLRGERLAWTFARLIAQAAHELDPSITVLGYSLHPLWAEAQDEISLDDLGDAGAHEATWHGQWSIWAALAGERGSALMGSSGYLWEADPDVLMNSAILGAPGANLPRALPDGTPLPAAHLARRRAVFRWHRRTTRWEPLWLDSSFGNLQEEPTVRNWGRVEMIGSERAVTALALRDPWPAALAEPLINGLRWTGRWIVLAQGDASIFAGREVALIPLVPGTLELPSRKPAAVQAIFTDRPAVEIAATWEADTVTLRADETLLSQPLLGFLLKRES
jgi:hypothetical protein